VGEALGTVRTVLTGGSEGNEGSEAMRKRGSEAVGTISTEALRHWGSSVGRGIIFVLD